MDNQKDTNLATVSDNKNTPHFVILKTERLTSALYLVTSLISDSDPLKWKLREKALTIFEGVKKIKETKSDLGVSVWSDFDGEHLVAQFEEILSLIEVAMSAGTVSTMNLALLKQEYGVLKNFLADLSKQKMGHFLMTEMNDRLTLPSAISHQQTTWSKGHISHNTVSDKKETYISQNSPQNSIRKPIGQSYSSVKSSSGESDSSFKSDRQVKIKAFLKDKSWTSITDIATSVPGCSIKTVQRDLSEMVDHGTLRKKGDRRWSRYMIA